LIASRVFPSILDAPDDLCELAHTGGGCGPLAAWLVLRHFGREVPSTEVLRACRFDPELGTFAIAIAVGLAECGLSVEFSTDTDPAPTPLEREMYDRAREIDLTISAGRTVAELRPLLDMGAIAILAYQLDWEVPYGHFSPLVAIAGTTAILSDERAPMEVAELEERRRAPGLFRQCVIAFPSPAT